MGFLFAWTLWFQAYIYTEPATQLWWRAPAAGTALALPRGGGLSSTHAMPWNHWCPGGSSRWWSSLQSA